MLIQSDWVGYHFYLWHGTSVGWHTEPGLSLYQLQQIGSLEGRAFALSLDQLHVQLI